MDGMDGTVQRPTGRETDGTDSDGASTTASWGTCIFLKSIDELAQWEDQLVADDMPHTLQSHIKGVATRPDGDAKAETEYEEAEDAARAFVILTLSTSLHSRFIERFGDIRQYSAKTIVDKAVGLVLQDACYRDALVEFTNLEQAGYESVADLVARMGVLWRVIKHHHDRISNQLYITVALKVIRSHDEEMFQMLFGRPSLSIDEVTFFMGFCQRPKDLQEGHAGQGE